MRLQRHIAVIKRLYASPSLDAVPSMSFNHVPNDQNNIGYRKIPRRMISSKPNSKQGPNSPTVCLQDSKAVKRGIEASVFNADASVEHQPDNKRRRMHTFLGRYGGPKILAKLELFQIQRQALKEPS